MKTIQHAALALFSKLFAEGCYDRPDLPEYFVPRNWFHQKCREQGIAAPENFIEALKWEEEIGLSKHVKKVIRAYRKSKQERLPALT